MNFLSHFYFDRQSASPELVLGILLPDLIKNANKSWLLHPEKRKDLFIDDPGLSNIIKGWIRHLQVDRLFHSSDFFSEHTRAIRTIIVPLLAESPVRPSFLAHIALELMLDSLLITESLVDTNDFYAVLNDIDRDKLSQFLRLNNIEDPVAFFQFFDKFISSAYLKSYNEPHNIIYALNRICMRLWDDPLDEVQKLKLTEVLVKYQEELKNSFRNIFDYIEARLN